MSEIQVRFFPRKVKWAHHWTADHKILRLETDEDLDLCIELVLTEEMERKIAAMVAPRASSY